MMPGITRRRRRCSRRGEEAAVVGVELRKCTMTIGYVVVALMALLLLVPGIHSFEHGKEDDYYDSPPSMPRGGAHQHGQSTRNAQTININSYCGKDWSDAYSSCLLACPNGRDSDCATLGEDYLCQSFTMCHENIQNGSRPGGPQGLGGGNNNAKPWEVVITPAPTPTSKPTFPPVSINFPECPPEYAAGQDYTLGRLVAFPPVNSGGGGGDQAAKKKKEVYECQSDLCNAGPSHAPGTGNAHMTWNLVGSCDDNDDVVASTAAPTAAAETTTMMPTLPPDDDDDGAKKWWVSNDGDGGAQCAYGDDYPESFATNDDLKERFVFDSREECCARYPDLCGWAVGDQEDDYADDVDDNADDGNGGATTATAIPPTPGMGQQPMASPSVGPTASSSTEYPTAAGTYFPTESSGAFDHRGGRLSTMMVGGTTIAVVAIVVFLGLFE